jgi:phosphopantetheinyl transferase
MEIVQLSFPEGHVTYGNLACAAGIGSEQRREAKLRSARSLLAANGAFDHPPDRIGLTADPLGKPQLYVGPRLFPAVSFSWTENSLWAALSTDCSKLGIDAASPGEFGDGYPFAEVFQECGLRHVMKLGKFDLPWVASMLWSVKEAAVKMLGCGFHRLGPGEVHITALSKDRSAWLSDVAISRGFADRKIRSYSFEQDWGWLSFALDVG